MAKAPKSVKGMEWAVPYDVPTIHYEADEWIETGSGNKIGRATLCGLERIMVVGKSILEHNTVVRGDLAQVSIGEYSVIGENTVLRPAPSIKNKGSSYVQIEIGGFTVIEKDCVVEAAKVGNCVHIAKNCVIGERCVLSDCCSILADSVLPPETIVPPFAVYAGNPAKLIDTLPVSYEIECMRHTKAFYEGFQPH